MSQNLPLFDDRHVEQTREILRDNWLADSRPWVVAYSGGKDSTLTLQLVLETLTELPAQGQRDLHVLSSDTRVESPNIAAYIANSLERIRCHAGSDRLRVHTHLVTPDADNGFWVNLIGRGYPPPTRWFRWCTSKMKIKPVRATIQWIADHFGQGSVILLLGSRRAESSHRGQRMEGRLTSSRGLNPHREIANALVLAPIAHWTNDQVWEYLTLHRPPWGGTHREMMQLYRDANAGECPVVMDSDTPTCGGSRFGCWTCTVVKEDRSMQGFIAAGNERFLPLLSFRDWLKDIRENNDLRNAFRRNGEKGLGPFNSEARRMILDRLLQTEQTFGERLISDEELLLIQKEWTREFDVRNSALRTALQYGRNPKRGR